LEASWKIILGNCNYNIFLIFAVPAKNCETVWRNNIVQFANRINNKTNEENNFIFI